VFTHDEKLLACTGVGRWSHFPSEILERIDDARYPSCKIQLDRRVGPSDFLLREHAAPVGVLLSMLESMPARVMTLAGDDLVEFSEAIEAIRLAVRAWANGENGFKLERIPGRKNLNPVSIVRKHLLKLPDQGADDSVADLAFVVDPGSRTN
jgi:hypothetical protein